MGSPYSTHHCLHCGWRYLATCSHPACPVCAFLELEADGTESQDLRRTQRDTLRAVGGKTDDGRDGEWLH